MRELTLDEISSVAGGLQQTTGGDGGNDGSGGGSGGSGTPPPPPPPPVMSMVSPTAYALQQFFDDFSDAAATNNQYSGSDYDHDSGADYAPYDMNQGIPSHDPGNAYWNSWDQDIDPEFLEAITAGTPNYVISGTLSLPDLHLDSTVALDVIDSTHLETYVDGQFLVGTYHGVAPPPVNPNAAGTLADPIVITGSGDGYWTFSFTGAPPPQSAPPPINVGGQTVNFAAPGSGNGYNGTTGYPVGWNNAYDHDIDAVASDLASKISAKVDSETREYGAFIWRDTNGALHETDVLPGNYNDAGSYSPTDYGVPQGATLVGFIHNHPSYYTVTDAAGNIVSRTPNAAYSYTDSGDMNSMNWVVQHYNSGQYPNDPINTWSYNIDNVGGINYYRNYVVASGNVSEYDFIQHQGYIPGNNYALPNAVKGNYNP